MNTERKDVYSRITSQIVASLEQGVRPWIRSWNAEHAPDGSPGHCVITGSPTPALMF